MERTLESFRAPDPGGLRKQRKPEEVERAERRHRLAAASRACIRAHDADLRAAVEADPDRFRPPRPYGLSKPAAGGGR